MSTEGQWRRIVEYAVVDGLKPGWRGLWRHFLAIMRREPVLLVPHTVTLSAWLKAEEGVEFKLTAVQEER